MLLLSLSTLDTLLIKFGAITLLDTIKASTVFATLSTLIDFMKLILEGLKGI